MQWAEDESEQCEGSVFGKRCELVEGHDGPCVRNEDGDERRWGQ